MVVVVVGYGRRRRRRTLNISLHIVGRRQRNFSLLVERAVTYGRNAAHSFSTAGVFGQTFSVQPLYAGESSV